jgi:hypothetical protein
MRLCLPTLLLTREQGFRATSASGGTTAVKQQLVQSTLQLIDLQVRWRYKSQSATSSVISPTAVSRTIASGGCVLGDAQHSGLQPQQGGGDDHISCTDQLLAFQKRLLRLSISVSCSKPAAAVFCVGMTCQTLSEW